MSNRPIKLKDLIDVKFTPINDRDSKTALISKQVTTETGNIRKIEVAIQINFRQL